MALDLDFLEDIKAHERPAVIRGWESAYLCALRDVVWEEGAVSPPYHFRPFQMWLTPTKFVIHTQQLSDELVSKLSEALSIAATDIDQLCEDYVDRVSDIRTVREVLVVEEEEITTIWTIIKAPPFEDSLREPIYTAQLQILRSLGQDIPLDFHVLNESELPTDEKLSEIIPSNARRIWRR